MSPRKKDPSSGTDFLRATFSRKGKRKKGALRIRGHPNRMTFKVRDGKIVVR